jgi:fumarylacetoacetase
MSPSLNKLMALGSAQWPTLRKRLSDLLRADAPKVGSIRETVAKCLLPISGGKMEIPAEIGDFTDFYASIHHAQNVGSMLRPENPLLPNYRYVPIAYHGRSSSIVVSGTPIRRPSGQTRNDQEKQPGFGPCRQLDYELEIGLFVGPGNALGKPIRIQDAGNHAFGLCLLNDWSARDIQKWEYQPLGPFLAKNFATTISPWVVTMEALEPFRVPAFQRPDSDPPPLPYLTPSEDRMLGGIDVTLEVLVTSKQMREQNFEPYPLSKGNFKEMYWTFDQMLAHHTSNGCNLRPGDLIGSGTVSGSSKESRGCLLELTWRGSEPIRLPTGELRRFLEDGDDVVMRGYCRREGFAQIGLGECRGRIIPP